MSTGLNEQADRLRRVEIDVSNRVPDKVPRQAPIVFQWNFDEYVVGDPRRFVDQHPGMLHVLHHVSQDRKIEACVRVRDPVAIELAALDQRPDLPAANPLDTGCRDLQREMPLTESAGGKALQHRSLACTDFQHRRVRMGAAQETDIVRLVDGPKRAPLGYIEVLVIGVVVLLQLRIDASRLHGRLPICCHDLTRSGGIPPQQPHSRPGVAARWHPS